MNILLTNDDGCDAPGLCAAYDALIGLGTVHIVVPTRERSACSHAITLGRPITVQRRTHEHFGRMYAVDGTPADCVRLGAAELIDRPVDLVVSGVNRGANSGVDVYYSGTVAGAREGAILSIRSISVSQAIRPGLDTDWPAASGITAVLVRELVEEPLPGPGFWSINLPAPIPPDPRNHVHRVPVATEPMPMKFERGERDDGRVIEFAYGARYWDRVVSGPSDFATIRDGGIAVSAIPLHGRF